MSLCPFNGGYCDDACAIYCKDGCSFSLTAHRIALMQIDIDNISRDIESIKYNTESIVERSNSDE